MPAPKPFQFNSSTPGGGAQTAGYNNAMQQLGNSLNASQNTTQAGQMQLQNQLQQNQSGIQQNLTNRGLGNTTVANTMQQLPQQTYNLGMAQLSDLGNMRQMSAYQNLANMSAQGGNAISGMNQPYAQTQYMQNMMRQQQPQIPNAPAAPTMGQGGGLGQQMAMGGGQQGQGGNNVLGSGMNYNQYQNLMNQMQPTYFGPGSPAGLAGGNSPVPQQPQDQWTFNGAFADYAGE